MYYLKKLLRVFISSSILELIAARNLVTLLKYTNRISPRLELINLCHKIYIQLQEGQIKFQNIPYAEVTVRRKLHCTILECSHLKTFSFFPTLLCSVLKMHIHLLHISKSELTSLLAFTNTYYRYM